MYIVCSFLFLFFACQTMKPSHFRFLFSFFFFPSLAIAILIFNLVLRKIMKWVCGHRSPRGLVLLIISHMWIYGMKFVFAFCVEWHKKGKEKLRFLGHLWMWSKILECCCSNIVFWHKEKWPNCVWKFSSEHHSFSHRRQKRGWNSDNNT